MLAAAVLGVPLKWIEDRQENLLARGKSASTRTARSAWRSTPTGDPGRQLDFVSDSGAYPTPWPMLDGDARRPMFPGPYRVPAAGFACRTVYSNTAAAPPYRGPWQYETARPRDDVRRRRPPDGHRPGRAAAPQPPAAATTCPTPNPYGMLYDDISPLETFEQALRDPRLRRLPRRAGRGAREGRYLGVGISQLRRADHARASASLGPRAPRSASSRRAR